MKIFIILIIIFFVLILLSFIPYIKNTLSQFFDSRQFKAIRFIITVFGIISLILGLLNWYVTKNPKVATKETSFQLNVFNNLPNFPSMPKEDDELKSALNNILYNPFVMCFMQGWQPVLTEIDNNHNTIAKSFTENKGRLISKQEIDNELLPGRSIVTIRDFYIPPDATFNIIRKEIKGRSWGHIIIKNKYIELRLEIAVLDEICYVKMIYRKKGFLNYILYDYSDYDRWFKIISERILSNQTVNKKINEHLRKQKNNNS